MVLKNLLQQRTTYAERDGERFMDAVQNARLIANAERYYRIMYYGSRASWNLRDSHMFETLKTLLSFYGPDSKIIVWAHNSHIGDAAATEMHSRGEHNLGHLCRKEYGDRSYSIGFGTFAGTVAAASDWDSPMEIKTVLPSIPESYEYICHQTAIPSFLLNLRKAPPAVLEVLRNRAWSAPSASSTGRIPSSRATTFKPCCRSNSTNTSGLIRQRPSHPLKQKPLRQCLIPTRSGYESRLAAALRHMVSII